MNGLNSFEEMVKSLRYYQKQYFRYKEVKLLQEAKRLETQVDEYLKAKEDAYKNPSLFGDDNQQGEKRNETQA